MRAVEFLLGKAISDIEKMALLATVATIALVLRTAFNLPKAFYAIHETLLSETKQK